MKKTVPKRSKSKVKAKTADKIIPKFNTLVLSHIKRFESVLEKTDMELYDLEWKTYFGENPSDLRGLREKRLAVYNDLVNFKKIELYNKSADFKTLRDKTRNILSRWSQELRREILTTEGLKRESLSLTEFEDRLRNERGSFKLNIQNGSGVEKSIPFEETHNILKSEKNRSLREEVWKRRSKLGDIHLTSGFRDLIKKRNDFSKAWARELGLKNPDSYNFYSLRLKQMDFDEEKIFDIFGKLKEKSDDRTFNVVTKHKNNFGWEILEPWDIPFITYGDNDEIDKFFKVDELNDNTFKTVEGMGFTPKKYRLTFDLYPKKNKFDNAMLFTINPPAFIHGKVTNRGDIRLFANIIRGGLREQKTIFHEWGHLVHSAEAKQEFYLFRNFPSNPSLTEGVAGLFEHFPLEKEFFTQILRKKGYSGISNEKIEKLLSDFELQDSQTTLLELRLILARVYFERELYSNPDGNFNEIWSKSYSDFLFVERHDSFHAWVERPHFLTHPVYYQSYAVAALIKEQFYSYLKKKFGTVINNKKAGEHLKKNCFAVGNSKHWEEIVKDTSGEKLSPKPLLEKILK